MTDQEIKIRNYRHQAEEVRAIADGIEDSNCRNNLIAMADEFERLATAIETMKGHKAPRGRTVH